MQTSAAPRNCADAWTHVSAFWRGEWPGSGQHWLLNERHQPLAKGNRQLFSHRCFAGADQHPERPTVVRQSRRILPCLCKNLFGVLPGDPPFAVRMVEKALQRFFRPWPCSSKCLHFFEVEAKQLSPRSAECVFRRCEWSIPARCEWSFRRCE